jgi:hypothetical protein
LSPSPCPPAQATRDGRAFWEWPVVEPFQQRLNGFVQFREREKLLMTERRQLSSAPQGELRFQLWPYRAALYGRAGMTGRGYFGTTRK